MSNFLIKNRKKIFYLLFFLLFISLFLLWFPYLTKQELSCQSVPGFESVYPFPDFIYKLADYLESVKDTLSIVFIILWIILIILSLKKGILRAGFIILIMAFMFYSLIFWGNMPIPKSVDAKREIDLIRISSALERYYENNNNKYPGVSGSNQWNILEPALKKYIISLPKDHCSYGNSKWAYEYWLSPDEEKFVLKAYFQTHYKPLNNDLDGNIYGVYCGENGIREREFCLGNF